MTTGHTTGKLTLKVHSATERKKERKNSHICRMLQKTNIL